MCGIAGFVSNDQWSLPRDLSWIDRMQADLERAVAGSDEWRGLEIVLKDLSGRFDDFMSFALHAELAQRAEMYKKLVRVADLLEAGLKRLNDFMHDKGPSDLTEQLAEEIRDHLWQIREEVLGNVTKVDDILPPEEVLHGSDRARRFLAWAVELVMENLDRLEVRGRDSAGIAVQCRVGSERNVTLLPAWEIADGDGGLHVEAGVGRTVHWFKSSDGRPVITLVYKVANLVGRLGDNTSALRRAVRQDRFLWQVAGLIEDVNITAHTRWASNGIISLANCHPTDGILEGRDDEPTARDRNALFVLNGDVDNYQVLVDEVVHRRGYRIHPSITTDAKILPVFYRLGTQPEDDARDRFLTLMNSCDGSLAVVMQHPAQPRCLHIAQKGSGQSLFIGLLDDGVILASEVYGLASRTRRSYALSGTEKGGTQVTICTEGSSGDVLSGAYLQDGSPFELKGEPISIHSRDIYRGAYDYYFEKEIHEAPNSVRKTIRGKYRKGRGGRVTFYTDPPGAFSGLLTRLRDGGLPPIRRIMVIGQGTASVAAQGVAYLMERALARSRVSVGWCKASEMSGFLSDQHLVDMLLIAISQSGTTTDTNRTVDVAASHGAWVHAIVNRRNSALVTKSHSHLYTSDGRDVEMAVASTKAFYSQVTAGKLTALFLAHELRSLGEEEIASEIEELEKLPADIEWVLNQKDVIRECAEAYGPSSRNWAVVGNGPNKIAADEIRIKLSELCYKSIPCDFTEDKKHIDLSTEPLTIVVANDLPEHLVQDTAKEVAIFKAHSGKPIVLCARGEKRFAEYAERQIELPQTGGGLGFVTATVAGHLWGFYAAKAIDGRAEELRTVRSILTRALEDADEWNPARFQEAAQRILDRIVSGEMNTALPASSAAALPMTLSSLAHVTAGHPNLWVNLEAGVSVLNKAIEEMTRPVDTIRHQAKTVTVGISRPQEVIPAQFLRGLEALGISPAHLLEPDRQILRTIAPLVSEVHGGLLYEMVVSGAATAAKSGELPQIRLARRMGSCEGKASRYDTPRQAAGSKRTALRLQRAILGSGASGQENLVIIPLFDENTAEYTGIALFHLTFVPQASFPQKLGVLQALGNRYHELVERLEELSEPASLEEFVRGVSARDLVLTPLDQLLPDRTS